MMHPELYHKLTCSKTWTSERGLRNPSTAVVSTLLQLLREGHCPSFIGYRVPTES